MTKFIWWGMGTVILLSALVLWQWPSGKVKFIMCNVGQGDAFLITQGFSQLLIDTGKPNGGVLNCLGKHMPFWDRFVEAVIITHADNDHHGGLTDIMNRYRVNQVITTQSSALEIANITQTKSKLITMKQYQNWQWGQVTGQVIWPADINQADKDNKVDSNDSSLVIRISYDQQSIWFAGDVSEKVEQLLLNQNLIIPTKVLKVSHHGSNTATKEKFLQILRPQIALISVQANNPYHHPHIETIKRLSNLSIAIHRTDQEGEYQF